MTTYFIGDELECYPVWTSNVTESNFGAIAGVSRGMITIPDNNIDYVECPLKDSVTGLPVSCNDVMWLHVRRVIPSYTVGRTPMVMYTSTGVATLREIMTGGYESTFQMWNGSTWVDLGPQRLASSWYAFFDIDIRIKIAVAGSVEIFHSGISIVKYVLDTTPIGNIGKVRFCGGGQGDGRHHSMHQVIIADYSTIAHTVRRRTPTGAGTNQAWSGTFADVDDDPSTVIGTDVVSTTASGNKITFAGNTLGASTPGHVVKAIAVAAFAKNDGTGNAPQNLRLILRSGGVDFEAPMNSTIGAGWTGGQAFWENNPQTGAAWANITAANATEFGFSSKD